MLYKMHIIFLFYILANYIATVDSVHYIAGRSNANMSWIFLEIPPGNLLEICSVKFVDTLFIVLYCCCIVLLG